MDTDLVLSPLGLMLVMRLREAFDLWLPPGVWRILDDADLILSRARSVLKKKPGNESDQSLPWNFLSNQRVFVQWDRARTESDIAGLNLYWLGDERSESLLPQDVDAGIVGRFQALSHCLEYLHPAVDNRNQQCVNTGSGNSAAGAPPISKAAADPHDPIAYLRLLLSESYRDCACLAAALVFQKGFILTLCRPDKEADVPAICAFMQERQIQTLRGDLSAMEKNFLLPVLVNAGIAPIMRYADSIGHRLALIHLVAPAAVAVPDDQAGGENYEKSDASSAVNWWQGCRAFWYPLTIE